MKIGMALGLEKMISFVLLFYTGRSPAVPEARPAAAIVNSPVCARTRLPLTSAQFIRVTEVRHETAS